MRMYVDESRRRMGYGRELVESLRAFATDATSDDSFELSLTTPSVNVPGIGFYCSLGFALERTFVVPGPDGKPLDLTELRCGGDAGVLPAHADGGGYELVHTVGPQYSPSPKIKKSVCRKPFF